MMNPVLALKVTTYGTCIYNALATESHLAKPITWLGGGVWIYNSQPGRAWQVTWLSLTPMRQ